MRVARLILSVSISSLLSISLAAQQTATSSPQALLLLRQSAAALSGGQTLTDVTLSGTARRIAGSDDDTGTAVLKAIALGASRINLALSSGQRAEILNTTLIPPAGTWSGPDGVSHVMAYHNLLTGPAWFFPAFTIVQGLSASGYVAAYVGPETHNGQAVQHVSLSQPSLLPATRGGTHLTQVDLFLDSTTLLPSAIALNIHPDDNFLLDIPVEVRFTDYRTVNAAHVPFHVQQYINNSLSLDFQFQSVRFNSGLATSTFSVE